MRRALFTLAVVGAVCTVAACDKKSDTSSSPAASATVTSESTLQPVKYDKSKFPARGTHPISAKAIKGGTGPTAPNAMSKKLSEKGTDREMRKPARVDMADCTKQPDNAAECDGDSMYYCDDQRLWVVDCNAEAKFGGVDNGSCFEADTFTECLGCGAATDSSTVCCDFEMTVCCDQGGACYSPKS
jgi:hypothetical protein